MPGVHGHRVHQHVGRVHVTGIESVMYQHVRVQKETTKFAIEHVNQVSILKLHLYFGQCCSSSTTLQYCLNYIYYVHIRLLLN